MGWIAALLAATVAPLARAESRARDQGNGASSSSEATARKLFLEGNQLLEQAHYSDALKKFVSAYAAWKNPKIQLNIATTLRALGRHAAALDAYELYLLEAQPTSERRREVEAICEELEGRVARLSVTLGPGVQGVMLDGQRLAADAARELRLDPGLHVLVTEAHGTQHVTNIVLSAGDHERFAASAAAESTPAREATPRMASAPESSESKPSAGRFGVTLRADLEGTGQGAVAAAGLVYELASHWQLSAGGLLGAHAGAWAGVELALFSGALRPTLGVSAPVFFVDSPRVGVSSELGGRWALRQDILFAFLRGAVVHFPSLPSGFQNTTFVASLGTELRL